MDFNLTVTLRASETNPTTVGEVATLNAETSFTLPVTVTAVANAPTLATPTVIGNEDVSIIFGNAISYGLVDTDGSEVVSTVALSGAPVGATVTYAVAPGASVNLVSGVWTITGSQSAIRTTLDSFAVRAAPQADANFSLMVAVTTTDTGGITATSTSSLPIVVKAVADAPVGSGNGSGNEDSAIALSINIADVDTDGSQSITSVQIAGVPTGGSLSLTGAAGATITNLGGGVYDVSGIESAIRTVLATASLNPPPNAHGIYNLSVTVTSSETSPSEVGDVAVLSASTTFVIAANVAAVADAPAVLVGSGAFTGEEDTRIALTGLSASLVDADGSESLTSVRITGVPAGARFTTAAGVTLGTDNGDGSWSFAPAQLAGLHFVPVLNLHGTVNLALEVTATEASNGSAATTTRAFTVTVDAQADAPVVGAGSQTINEDVQTVVGTGISYGLTDTDGSERVSSVTVTGFPGGAAVTLAAVGSAVVTAVAGGYTVSGPSADIRATLDGLAMRPPVNSDADIPLTVAVTTTDADGSTAVASNTFTLNVSAVADAPTVSGSASGNEDTAIAVPVTVALTDTDGSETLASVVVSQVPVGAVLAWNTGLPGSVVNGGGGSFTFTGTTGQIQALLLSLTITPPLHSDADFNLRITATSSESNPSGGQVTTPTAVTVFDVPVTVTAVADQATVPNNSTNGTEDSTITFGTNVAYSLTDADGTETITKVAVSGVPAGWTLAYVATGGGSVSLAAGVYEITGTPAGIRATLDTFNLTPPLDDDSDAVLTIAVTTADNDGSTAVRNATHTVVVAADADTPVVAVGTGTFSGNEDSIIVLSGFSAAITDTDAGAGRPVSEVFNTVRITGVPTGSSFQNGLGAAVGTNTGGGVWTFTAAQLADLRFVPTPQLSGTLNMALEAIARETSNSDLSTVASVPFVVTLLAQPDVPIVTVGTSTGNEDATITFGTAITYVQPDNLDGSERVTEVVISGVDPAWFLTYSLVGGASVNTSVPGTYRITGPSELSIRNTLNTFALRAPVDSDADTSVQVTVTSTDVGGGTATSAPLAHNIVVNAVADTPSVNVGAATFNTNEDTRVSLAGFAVAIADTDASAGRPISESISLVRITGVSVEAGTAFQNLAGTAVGTNLGGGIWTFTPAQIAAGLYYVPGTNRAGTYNMVLEATAQESSNLNTAVFTRSFTVNVTGVPDQVAVAPVAINLNEDTLTAAGVMSTALGITLSDNDGSQTLRVVLTGLPTSAGSSVSYTPSAGLTTNTFAGGVLTLDGPSDRVLTTIGTLRIRQGTNRDADISIGITATTTENGTTLANVTGTLPITVRAVADAPTVSGSVTALEDVPRVLPITISLPDNDGSETFNYVDIRLSTTTLPAPAGTVLSVVASGGASAVFNGGTKTWRVTGTTAAIQATLLGGVTVTTAANNGTNFNVQVSAQSREAATGGQVATPTATLAFTNLLVTVTDVADKPDLTVPTPPTIQEDTSLTLTGLGIIKVDTDGSETFRLTLAGVPDGASFGGRGSASAPVGGVRTWTFTEAEVSGLTFTPPFNLHGSWVISATTTATETENGNAATSNIKTFTINSGCRG